MMRTAALMLLATLTGSGVTWWLTTRTEADYSSSTEAWTPTDSVAELVRLQEQFDTLPFPELVERVTGKQVLASDANDPAVQRLQAAIRGAMPKVMAYLNAEDSPARSKRRINEVSGLVEDVLREALQADERVSCTIPETVDGSRRRSGYPDLKLVDQVSGRVAYLDPKLYEAKSERSSQRTFYFQPNAKSGKIRDDAHHWLLGLRHDGQTRAWQFDRWTLVDLHSFQIGLKVEFQGSNRDLYRMEMKLDSQNKE